MIETPQNGIKGLKHWRYDLLAGLQVALVSLPLSLGIAIASGAPAVTGLISAIIAGLIFPFLGGAFVTISGPAAGLAPALLSGMLLLGGGDLAAGYPLLLVAICLTGLLQIVLAYFKTGRYAIFLPITVVEAMLAAIGLIIIIKQIPSIVGAMLPASSGMLNSIVELPTAVSQGQLSVAFIGAVSLALIFYLNKTSKVWMRKIPPPLTITVLGIFLGYLFGLDAKYLISMPDDIIENGITMPAFGEVFSRPDLWWGVLVVVITLTLIDGIESLATIKAVDKIDPFQRKSDPNVTLRAMGISNSLSSIFGGLTIIPGGIKSTTNIDAGGRTLWANFYNAMFLLVFLFLMTDILALVPLASIAAILIYVGWKLCQYKVFTKTYSIGRDQLIVFIITILSILATDLLFGILIGIAAEIFLLLYLLTPSVRYVLTGRMTAKNAGCFMWSHLKSLFQSPLINVREVERDGKPHYEMTLSTLVCFNLLPLDKILAYLPDDVGVTLTITESGRIIDHTAMEYLHQFEEECVRDGRIFELHGLENFTKFTPHSLAARMQDTVLAKENIKRSEREAFMDEVATSRQLAFDPTLVSTLNKQGFVYLRRGNDKEECNAITGKLGNSAVRLFDYSHTAAPDYYAKHWRTIITSKCAESSLGSILPNLVITPGYYLERYLVNFTEVGVSQSANFSDIYRLYVESESNMEMALPEVLVNFLILHREIYLEIKDGVILAFIQSKHLATKEDAEKLLQLAEIVNEHSIG